MDLHQLYVFTKVVELNSFSKAAEDIFLSQSTVSSHIHSLEKMLNVKLFDRIGRDIVLTPYGERLYHWAQALLKLKDQALLDIKHSASDYQGSIRIETSSVPGQFILPKVVKQFREKYPKVTFHINQSSSKIVADKVLNGTVDIGILGEKYENEKLQYLPLLKEKLVLITSKKIKLNSPVDIQEIRRYPIVMRNSDSGTNAILQRFLAKNQIDKESLNIIAYTDSQSLIQFVIQNIGIAIISEITAKEYWNHHMLNMYEIDGFDYDRYFYLAYNEKRTLSLVTKLFIKEVKDSPPTVY
jgi:DNA-binding transcriptional LysR family regulator